MPNRTERKPWSRKQWTTRRAVLDRLNFWQANGFQCLWVTLTSSPASPFAKLRKDFQALRKRIARQLGFEPIEYICVDTREGHGVLHMIWAWKDADTRKRASFFIEFAWLQETWKELHGAFHVNVKRIGGSSKDARRLSRYIVSQYCGDQDGLVRVSQSRPERPLAKMREALRRVSRTLGERYDYAATLSHLPSEELTTKLRKATWARFKEAWDQLVKGGSCELWGVQFVWLEDRLQRV